MVVTTDRFIIDAIGPFNANVSDAKLLEDLMCKEEFKKLSEPSQTILIVDRGFRDAIEKAKQRHYEIHMPSFLSKQQKQLSEAEANMTRFAM